MSRTKAPPIVDTVKDLVLKLGAADKEIGEIKARLDQIPNASFNQDALQGYLDQRFGEQRKDILEMMSKHDVAERKYIDDSIVSGVTEGITQFSKMAESKFVTKTDSESAAFAEGAAKAGAGRPPSRSSGDFLSTIGGIIKRAVESGEGSGQSGGDFKEIYDMFQKEWRSRMRLDFRNYVKNRFNEPSAPTGSGHVEISG